MLALVSIGFFITALDFTIVNVAFRPIEADFGPGAASLLPWTLSGYSIAFAAGLLTAGRMADAFGRKRAFLLGNVMFTAASLVCGFAPTAAVLVIGRVIQAIGGAMIVPTATALVLPEYPVEQRTHVFGITTAMGSIAAGAGPVVGGVLTTQLGWQWVFFINLPIGAVTITVGARLLRGIARPDAARRSGLPRRALAVSSVGLLVLAIVEGERWGWGSAATLGVVAAAVVLGSISSALPPGPDPVLDLSVFRFRYVRSPTRERALVDGLLLDVLHQRRVAAGGVGVQRAAVRVRLPGGPGQRHDGVAAGWPGGCAGSAPRGWCRSGPV